MIRVSRPRHQGHQVHPTTLSNAKTQRRKDAKATRPPEKPQRHRGTEIARRFFQIPSQPRRHKDTKKSQSPPTQKRRDAEAQRRRGAFAGFLCVARSRPANDDAYRFKAFGETPWPSNGHGVTGSGNRLESELSCRFPDPVTCALAERRPRHLSSPFIGWKAHNPHYNNTEERQNRRAYGASAGEKTGGDGCLHPESSGFSPATGDLLIACRSAGKKRKRPTDSVTAPLRLCAFAPLRFFLCVSLCASVSLWFVGRRSPGIVE
jgi:hypothetical protein